MSLKNLIVGYVNNAITNRKEISHIYWMGFEYSGFDCFAMETNILLW